VRQYYAKTAAWLKLRELYFDHPSRKDGTAQISYERMIREPAQEFRKFATTLGCGNATDATITRVVEVTLPQALALRNASMRDLHGHPKVRDAGQKNYTGYGMSTATLAWMDAVYERLEIGTVELAVGRPAPDLRRCARQRQKATELSMAPACPTRKKCG